MASRPWKLGFWDSFPAEKLNVVWPEDLRVCLSSTLSFPKRSQMTLTQVSTQNLCSGDGCRAWKDGPEHYVKWFLAILRWCVEKKSTLCRSFYAFCSLPPPGPLHLAVRYRSWGHFKGPRRFFLKEIWWTGERPKKQTGGGLGGWAPYIFDSHEKLPENAHGSPEHHPKMKGKSSS